MYRVQTDQTEDGLCRVSIKIGIRDDVPVWHAPKADATLIANFLMIQPENVLELLVLNRRPHCKHCGMQP